MDLSSIITVYKTLLNLRQLLHHLKKYMVIIILWTEFLNVDIIKPISRDPLFMTPSLLGLLELLLGLLDLLVHLRLLLVLLRLPSPHLRLHLLRLLRLYLLRLRLLAHRHLLRRQLRWRPYDH